ncbi:MAG: (2Fe-2S) ferredoxin domain-containing protein [Planctomycetota bacterium]
MAKIRSLADLRKIKDEVQIKNALREGGYTACVTVHMGTCGIASGAREVMRVLLENLANSRRKDIRATTSGCIGLCSHEPLITVERLKEEPVRYAMVDSEKMNRIFKEHVIGGKPVVEYALVMDMDTED